MASRNSPPPVSSPAEATADRRQDILNAALACAAEGGVDAVTIDGVRARCGASVGSIYHHFGNRDGIVAGDPSTFERADSLADENTLRMMSAISNLLPPEAREHREPTKAELRAALPSNYKGDLNAEDTRRPGTD